MGLFGRKKQTDTSHMTTAALEQHLRVLAAEQCKVLIPVIDRAHAESARGTLMPAWQGYAGEESLRTHALGSGSVVIYGGHGTFLAEELQRHYGDKRVRWQMSREGRSDPHQFIVAPKG
jgi:hypothetical protein